MKLLPIALTLFIALSACGRSSPTSYYLLEEESTPMTVTGVPKKTLRVAQVETPAYLGRNNIISRVKGESRVIVAQFHLWAEPVSNGVRRIIEESLTRPMLDLGVYVLPGGTEEHGDYVLVVDIQRLDGNFDEKAVLEARWTLLDKNDQPLERGIFADEKQVDGASYNMLARTESQLLREFGDRLARDLAAALKGH